MARLRVLGLLLRNVAVLTASIYPSFWSGYLNNSLELTKYRASCTSHLKQTSSGVTWLCRRHIAATAAFPVAVTSGNIVLYLQYKHIY